MEHGARGTVFILGFCHILVNLGCIEVNERFICILHSSTKHSHAKNLHLSIFSKQKATIAQVDRQTFRQTDRQTDKQTGKQTIGALCVYVRKTARVCVCLFLQNNKKTNLCSVMVTNSFRLCVRCCSRFTQAPIATTINSHDTNTHPSTQHTQTIHLIWENALPSAPLRYLLYISDCSHKQFCSNRKLFPCIVIVGKPHRVKIVGVSAPVRASIRVPRWHSGGKKMKMEIEIKMNYGRTRLGFVCIYEFLSYLLLLFRLFVHMNLVHERVLISITTSSQSYTGSGHKLRQLSLFRNYTDSSQSKTHLFLTA